MPPRLILALSAILAVSGQSFAGSPEDKITDLKRLQAYEQLLADMVIVGATPSERGSVEDGIAAVRANFGKEPKVESCADAADNLQALLAAVTDVTPLSAAALWRPAYSDYAARMRICEADVAGSHTDRVLPPTLAPLTGNFTFHILRAR